MDGTDLLGLRVRQTQGRAQWKGRLCPGRGRRQGCLERVRGQRLWGEESDTGPDEEDSQGLRGADGGQACSCGDLGKFSGPGRGAARRGERPWASPGASLTGVVGGGWVGAGTGLLPLLDLGPLKCSTLFNHFSWFAFYNRYTYY